MPGEPWAACAAVVAQMTAAFVRMSRVTAGCALVVVDDVAVSVETVVVALVARRSLAAAVVAARC